MNELFDKYAHVHTFTISVTKKQALLLEIIRNCDNNAQRELRNYVPTVKSLLRKGLVEHTKHWNTPRPFHEMPLGTKRKPSLRITEEGFLVLKLMNKTTILDD